VDKIAKKGNSTLAFVKRNLYACSEKTKEAAHVSLVRPHLEYHKVPKISPGAYIFQRLFLRGLFLERLIFGGVYLRREICISKRIGLAS